MRAILLVDHGSTRAEANAMLACMANLVQHLVGLQVKAPVAATFGERPVRLRLELVAAGLRPPLVRMARSASPDMRSAMRSSE